MTLLLRYAPIAKQGSGGLGLLAALRAFLAQHEPAVLIALLALWRRQAASLQPDSLPYAAAAGSLPDGTRGAWQNDAAQVVAETFAPLSLQGLAAGAAEQPLLRGLTDFTFDPASPAARAWLAERGGALAVGLSEAQHQALREALVAGLDAHLGTDELARAVRPLVGLLPRQTAAVLRYQAGLQAEGFSIAQVASRVERSAQAHKQQRAMTIARTELASAWSAGASEGIRQAQAAGLVGPVRRRWSTADDERTCPICQALDGVTVAEGQPFAEGIFDAPAHVACRCAVAYLGGASDLSDL